MPYIKTLGELRNLRPDLPDNTPLFTNNSNTMEQRGLQRGIYVNDKLIKVSIHKETTWDRFDGGDYEYDCIDIDPNGSEEGLKL